MSLFSFLSKYGEAEDPLFRSMPVETNPIPDERQSELVRFDTANEQVNQANEQVDQDG